MGTMTMWIHFVEILLIFAIIFVVVNSIIAIIEHKIYRYLRSEGVSDEEATRLSAIKFKLRR